MARSNLAKEMQFFEKVKAKLRNREAYQDLLKTLNMFAQEITRRDEMLSMVHDIIGRMPDLMARHATYHIPCLDLFWCQELILGQQYCHGERYTALQPALHHGTANLSKEVKRMDGYLHLNNCLLLRLSQSRRGGLHVHAFGCKCDGFGAAWNTSCNREKRS